MTTNLRWTTADLRLLPDSSNRYEIIDGELLVTKAPHWGHQRAVTNTAAELRSWTDSTGLGETVSTPGIIFTDADNVIPDVVWISKERLAVSLDEAGHLTAAPELVVEVMSPGADNERRDREIKLKFYSQRGVQEYWILDWRLKQVEVYRHQAGVLQLICTLIAGDSLTSPLLPGFSCTVERLFVS
ncbi:Uma2 family endonuclease [Pantanalinema sp. GBBB05]|uniref:Uma2 family endonuclease n=1 Tax=Pantanalinema sp. GBBB05 TaxID=2604139 RepID=UPI001D472DBF|nr:Uma2 family endonuclease [Pantanalinema sp. GBBB05]